MNDTASDPTFASHPIERTIIAIFDLRASAARLGRHRWTRIDLIDNAACYVTDPGAFVQRDANGEDPLTYLDGTTSSRYWRSIPMRNATTFLGETFPDLPLSRKLVVCYDLDCEADEEALEAAQMLLEDEFTGEIDDPDHEAYALTGVRVVPGTHYPDVIAEHRALTQHMAENMAAERERNAKDRAS